LYLPPFTLHRKIPRSSVTRKEHDMSQPPVAPDYHGPPPGAKPQTMALASLITGILSLVFICGGCALAPLGFLSPLLGVAAIVTGVMARQRIARGEETGNGLALAGLICGIIAVVLFVIGLILIALGAGALWFFGDEIEQWEREWELDIEPGEPMPAPAPADPAMRRPASLQLVGHWP
jgi:hypothetical protein